MQPATMPRRPGLTLVEILVVITVISLLLALLIPWVQGGRESARRASCQNNLRQVGLALQAHAGIQGALPSLYNGDFLRRPATALDEFHFHSWRSAILGQIEQAPLWSQLNFSLPASVPANLTAINVRVAVFGCPSASNPTQVVPEIFEWNGGAPPVTKLGTAARSDYEALGGAREVRPVKTSRHLSGVEFGPWGEPVYDLSSNVSAGYRVATLADITDGLSQTILVAERAGRPDEYRDGRLFHQYTDLEADHQMDPTQAAWAISTHFYWLLLGPNATVNTSNRSVFSFHPGSANVALADGSVRVLKDTTSPATLRGLVTRAGAELAATP